MLSTRIESPIFSGMTEKFWYIGGRHTPTSYTQGELPSCHPKGAWTRYHALATLPKFNNFLALELECKGVSSAFLVFGPKYPILVTTAADGAPEHKDLSYFPLGPFHLWLIEQSSGKHFHLFNCSLFVLRWGLTLVDHLLAFYWRETCK